jgi:hypothetical protein
MIRRCCYCKNAFGEKCGACGSEDVHALFEVPAADCELWGCMACGTTWMRGSDGETHGICPQCYKAQKPIQMNSGFPLTRE